MSSNITDHIALKARLMHLQSSKVEKEEQIKRNAKEIYYSLDPVNILRNKARQIIEDKELRRDGLTAVLSLGADFIIDKLTPKNKGIKGFFSSLLNGKKHTSFADEHMPEIKSILSSLLSRFLGKAA